MGGFAIRVNGLEELFCGSGTRRGSGKVKKSVNFFFFEMRLNSVSPGGLDHSTRQKKQKS